MVAGRQNIGRQRHRRRAAALSFALILAAVSAAGAGELSLDVSASRAQVYLGESLILSVRVSGESSPPEPDISGIQGFKIRSLGSQSQDQVSITIINGRITRTGFFGRLFSYELTPEKTGELVAGPVRLVVGAKTLTAPGPAVKVIGLEEQDLVKIRVSSSRDTALVDDEFEITLSILLKRLPGAHAEIDPLDPRAPPSLQAPFLDDQPIEGLDTPNVRQILQQQLVSRPDRPGFAVNNYTARTDPFENMFDFESFFEKKPAQFQFSRRPVDKDGKAYFEYTLKLTYRTREEGAYTFGPVVFKGPVIRRIDAGGRLVKEAVFAVGPACTARVVPPPEEGRPISFIGAIGANLAAEATLDAQTCKVGDPLKLTVAVSGPAFLRNVCPPPINVQEELVRDFRVYDDTVRTERKDSAVRFVWTVRPITAGTLEIPPLDVSYYDPAARAYRIARTQPIPVQARPAHQVSADDIVGLATNEASVTITLTAGALAPAAITMTAAGAMRAPFYPSRGQLVAAAAGPLLFALVFAIRAIGRRRAERLIRRRRARACRRTLWALREARRTAAADPTDAGRLIVAALRKYLADRLEVAEAGLTPGDAADLLSRHAVAPDIAARFRDILQRHFDAIYQAENRGAFDTTADAVRAADLVEQIDATIAEAEKGKNPQ
ncbi:MAG: BatD family protein [Verrucomicrobiota bacterium]|nr:BatD family protein [Verrucomicrobiota bacterium]